MQGQINFVMLYKFFKEKIINYNLIIDDEVYQDFVNIIYQFNNKLHDKAPETKYGRGRY